VRLSVGLAGLLFSYVAAATGMLPWTVANKRRSMGGLTRCGGDVTVPLLAWTRGRHVWSFWSKVSGQIRVSLSQKAAEQIVRNSRVLSGREELQKVNHLEVARLERCLKTQLAEILQELPSTDEGDSDSTIGMEKRSIFDG
jgi:hypothetical protein